MILTQPSIFHDFKIEDKNLVVGAGFEPAKLSRQIYSLIPLAAREPHRTLRYCIRRHFKVKLLFSTFNSASYLKTQSTNCLPVKLTGLLCLDVPEAQAYISELMVRLQSLCSFFLILSDRCILSQNSPT